MYTCSAVTVLRYCALNLNIQDEMDCDPKAWKDMVKERILRSADAALVVLHITTAPNMPKNVHLEESIEQIITLTKYHLETNIYPQFDPVYKAENKGTCDITADLLDLDTV